MYKAIKYWTQNKRLIKINFCKWYVNNYILNSVFFNHFLNIFEKKFNLKSVMWQINVICESKC